MKPLSQPRAGTSFDFVSRIGAIDWPQIPDPVASGVAALLYQFEQSQWWPAEDLAERQWRQASLLLRHAYATTSFFRDLYDRLGVRPDQIGGWADWGRLPIIDRRSLQAAGANWRSDRLPPDHGALLQHFTSGSSGRPLQSSSTALTHIIKIALILRQHHWAQRDTSQKIVFIRDMEKDVRPAHHFSKTWEAATDGILRTGPALAISLHADSADQLALIRDFEPAYLISYPSIIGHLAGYCQEKKIELPFLRQVGTFGEALDPSCRRKVREAWGVGIADLYSAMEAGPIALQCPEHEHYHVQSEAVVVEILDQDGEECRPGEIGRVVLTSLHNFAAPLIRYDIGDLALKGAPCPCGRSLPVLSRILGRQRNLLRYPDGSRRWPSLGEKGFLPLFVDGAMPPLQQFQLVQHSTEQIEARVVVARPYKPEEEARLAGYLRDELGAHWRIDFSYPPVIERGSGGKYEDFLSLCP